MCSPATLPSPEMPVTWLRLSKKARGRLGRDCSSAPESVELLGKERSSDQCHMMQEVCQHFSSSSLARGREGSACPGTQLKADYGNES